jgi:uncharacterized membrane protein HdeD (DUF308 family)
MILIGLLVLLLGLTTLVLGIRGLKHRYQHPRFGGCGSMFAIVMGILTILFGLYLCCMALVLSGAIPIFIPR